MKNIGTLLAVTTFWCLSLQFPSQAQNLDSEIKISQREQKINSEEEDKDKNKDKEPTRSYTGIGGAIGISGGETPLGDGGFALVGKTAFSNNLSLHSSSVLNDDGVSLFALTYGIPIKNKSSEKELLFPFVGGGVAIEDLFGGFDVDALITAGVDVPISERIVGTARLGVSFPEDETDVGLTLGVGYRFSIFDLF